jgi:omega-6 fatty acid desaturase (delta-12 desaturase)
MTTGRNLILETIPFTAENKLLSWYYFFSTLILIVVAYTGTVFFTPLYLKVFSGILAGLLMTRMFVIYHDFQHEAIFRKSPFMKMFFTLFGIVGLAPVSIWDESHEHHHHNNSKFSTFVVGSFPVVSAERFSALPRAGKIKYLVIRHPLMIVFGYLPIFLVSFCLWPFFENPKKYWDCGVAAVIHIALAIGLYLIGGSQMLLCTLLIPCLLQYALGGYIFYAQHNFPNVSLKDDDRWDYFEAALNSSSYIRMNRIMQWFTANIGFHHIHHVNPRIPFYRLPEAMKALTELQHPRQTSLNPAEILRCLQLKLWDQDQEKLISLREYRLGNAVHAKGAKVNAPHL